MTHFNVIVIGGGLVGCAAAYYLSRSGARVLLIESGDINREASGRNAGSLHFQLEYRLIKYGDDQAGRFAQIIPLSLVAIEDWSRLETELQSDLEVRMGGGLIVAETAADVRLLEMRQSLQERWGLRTSLLSASEVRRRAPYLADTVSSASYCETEGHANPRLVAPAFARRAAALGATIRCRTRATALNRDGSGWQVRMLGNDYIPDEVTCDAVLNAAGAWAGDVAAMVHLHLPIFPVPLSMNVVERSEPLVPHLVQHASQRLTVKQVAAGNILIGGGWPSRFPRRESSMNIHQRPELVVQNIAENVALGCELIPALGRLHLLRSWQGTTGVTADQMPLLGEVPEAPRFYIAAGGAAFTHGPTYARLIGELILSGRPSSAIDLYSPSRFSHINNFMAAV
jgi:sarcosine oxidase, subunit beta